MTTTGKTLLMFALLPRVSLWPTLRLQTISIFFPISLYLPREVGVVDGNYEKSTFLGKISQFGFFGINLSPE